MSGGYMAAMGDCWACGRRFTFNPERVPSVPIDPATNTPADVGEHEPGARYVREPLCTDCVERANANRRASGQPLIVVLPGAYEWEGAS